MKLHQAIAEHIVPVTVQLSLAEIIRDGKVTNPYQIFVLAYVSEFFKNGVTAADFSTPITAGSLATSTVVVDALKALAPEDQVRLAAYLLECIKAGETLLSQPTASVIDWMHFVLRKQD